jgi:hypothetical protein
MKKIYLLAISVLAGSLMMAQSGMPGRSKKATITRENAKMSVVRVDAPQTIEMRDVLLEEDFQTGGSTPGDLPAGWLTNDVDQTEGTPDDTSDDTVGPAFRLHNSESANNGGYWPIPEVGVGNTFAGANDDGVPCDCMMDEVYLESPTVDFSASANPAIQFDVYHDGNFVPTANQFAALQVSSDGGASWTQVDYINSEDGLIPTDEGNWQHMVYTLFDYAGNSDVRFRFVWKDGGEWATGLAIDNVEVGNLESASLTMDKVLACDWNAPFYGYGLWEYSMIPLAQADTVRATSVLTNTGLNTMTNISVNLEVFKNGTSQGVWPSALTTAELVSLAKDTISVVTEYIPDAVGTYEITGTVVSDSVEADIADNSASNSFMVTECEYARDLGSSQGSFEMLSGDYGGNLFDIYTTQEFSSIQVALGNGSSLNSNTVTGVVYEFQGFDELSGDPIFAYVDNSQTQEVPVYEGDLNFVGGNNFICLPFEDPLTLEGGRVYLVAVEGTDLIRLPVSGVNTFPAIGSWLYRDTDASFGWPQGIFMIRLVGTCAAGCTVSVEENEADNGMALFNMPNPASNNTTINFRLESQSVVNMTVRDVTGKLVESINLGSRNAGNNTYEMNLSAYSSGVYTYTLEAGEISMTSRLIVK